MITMIYQQIKPKWKKQQKKKKHFQGDNDIFPVKFNFKTQLMILHLKSQGKTGLLNYVEKQTKKTIAVFLHFLIISFAISEKASSPMHTLQFLFKRKTDFI